MTVNINGYKLQSIRLWIVDLFIVNYCGKRLYKIALHNKYSIARPCEDCKTTYYR